MTESIILAIAAPIVTFLLGLIIKSPLYQKTTHLVQDIIKYASDGKLTVDELESLYDQIGAILKDVKRK